jgi:hypothetical protein
MSARMMFLLGTLAGVPVVALLGFVAAWLVRLRWKSLLAFAGLTVFASASIAAVWLRYDIPSLPAIETYDRSGWPLAVLLGAYLAGALYLFGWLLARPYRWLTRPRVVGQASA